MEGICTDELAVDVLSELDQPLYLFKDHIYVLLVRDAKRNKPVDKNS